MVQALKVRNKKLLTTLTRIHLLKLPISPLQGWDAYCFHPGATLLRRSPLAITFRAFGAEESSELKDLFLRLIPVLIRSLSSANCAFHPRVPGFGIPIPASDGQWSEGSSRP